MNKQEDDASVGKGGREGMKDGGGSGTWQLQRRRLPHRLRCHKGAKESFVRRESKGGGGGRGGKEGENEEEVKKESRGE